MSSDSLTLPEAAQELRGQVAGAPCLLVSSYARCRSKPEKTRFLSGGGCEPGVPWNSRSWGEWILFYFLVFSQGVQGTPALPPWQTVVSHLGTSGRKQLRLFTHVNGEVRNL